MRELDGVADEIDQDLPHALRASLSKNIEGDDPVGVTANIALAGGRAAREQHAGSPVPDAENIEANSASVRARPALRIQIVDTGIGLHGDQINRVFGEFEQADTTTTRRFGGTGLGLAISRRLARQMGGDIIAVSNNGEGEGDVTVFSSSASTANPAVEPRGSLQASHVEPGQSSASLACSDAYPASTTPGATFTLYLPAVEADGHSAPSDTAEAPARRTASAQTSPPQSELRVLIASARPIEVAALMHALEHAEENVKETVSDTSPFSFAVTALPPEDALERLRRGQAAGAPFDLLIADTSVHPALRRQLCRRHVASGKRPQLPQADAGQVQDAVSADPHRQCAPTAFIVLEPSVKPALAAFEDEGFNDYLIRPVRAQSLRRRIQAHTVGAAPEGAPDTFSSRVPTGAVEATPVRRIDERSAPNSAGLTAARGTIREPLCGHDKSVEHDDPTKPLRILIAEDNPVNALLAERLLARMGHSVVRVENGCEAVAAIEQSLTALEVDASDTHSGELSDVARDNLFGSDDMRFDLVLMDLHMPVMDGIDAVREIRARSDRWSRWSLPKQSSADNACADSPIPPGNVSVAPTGLGSEGAGSIMLPPIIALTANAFEEDRRRCLDAGMDDFLSKPFTPEALAEMVARWGHGTNRAA
ncbi:MAG: response regulator [Pseudomonadota bacterium]